MNAHPFAARLRTLLSILLFAAAWSASQSGAVAAGFINSTFATGLSTPTSMEFAPDGRLFVCERRGKVRVIQANGALNPVSFLDLSAETDFQIERGILGIAFDPQFTTNGYVYVYHTVAGSPAHNQVSRFTATGDVGGSRLNILDLDSLSTSQIHNAGAIHFGTDGMLYVAVGNNGNGTNSQSIANRLGKILRINPINGSPAAGNPTSFKLGDNSTVFPAFPNTAIWAMGLRNPFTFAVHPTSGRIFANDVGDGLREEIDDIITGLNYGYPTQEGKNGLENVNFKRPFIDYAHGDSGGLCICGGAFYRLKSGLNTFGASYLDKILLRGPLRRMDPVY